jgi:hypothetical protein
MRKKTIANGALPNSRLAGTNQLIKETTPANKWSGFTLFLCLWADYGNYPMVLDLTRL